MKEIFYQGRFLLRYLIYIILTFLFAILFLLLSLFNNKPFVLVSILFLIASYSFFYLSLPSNFIISDKGFFLKKKFFKPSKIFNLHEITELTELEYDNKLSFFDVLFDLFSSFSFLSPYKDSVSYVMEITDINLTTYKIYSYQTAHYNEIKEKLESIIANNRIYHPFE